MIINKSESPRKRLSIFTRDEDDNNTTMTPLKKDEITISNEAHPNRMDDASGKDHTLSVSSIKKV